MESYGFFTNSWPVRPVRKPSRKVRQGLAVTMAFESLLVIYLTARDFALAATPTISFVTLPAISGVGVWAAYATWVKHPSWPWASLLGQFSIAVLAGYTVLTDIRSPFPQLFVARFASILGIIAIFWVVYLIRYRPRIALPAWSTAIVAAIVTALATIIVPGIGFVQSWLHNAYLPRTSTPLVDVTTNLTPTGKTGDIVQLEAKVTITNRSSVPVYVGATTMRITAYPWRPPAPPTPLSLLPDTIQFGLRPSQEYRYDPLPTNRILLYADSLYSPGNVTAAGQSNTFRKVVDFDSGTMRLARLDVDGIFMTSPNIDKVYTCLAPPKDNNGKEVWFHDPDDPDTPPEPSRTKPLPPQLSADDLIGQFELGNPIYKIVPGGVQKFFCREIRLKPQNVIHELVGDQPRFEVVAIFKDPTYPDLQPPALLLWPGVDGKYDLNSRQWQKVSAANPTLVYTNIGAEYSHSEQSALPGGGTPSTTTTQPPSTTQPP